MVNMNPLKITHRLEFIKQLLYYYSVTAVSPHQCSTPDELTKGTSYNTTFILRINFHHTTLAGIFTIRDQIA